MIEGSNPYITTLQYRITRIRGSFNPQDKEDEYDLRIALEMMEEFIKSHIESGGAGAPEAWEPLKPDTLRIRAGKLMMDGGMKGLKGVSGLSYYNSKTRGGQIAIAAARPLINTGFLLEHAVEGFEVEDNGRVGKIWTGYDVAMFHNKGVPGKFPMRQFYYVTAEEKAQIKEVVTKALIRAWSSKKDVY